MVKGEARVQEGGPRAEAASDKYSRRQSTQGHLMTDHPDANAVATGMTQPPDLLPVEALRWLEHVAVLELYTSRLPRRTGQVATALVFLDRELPMSSREIAKFARTGHETVRRSADALEAEHLIDRHRRPLYHARASLDRR